MLKAIQLLESLQEQMLEVSEFSSHINFSVAPKISKGENYEGLPYVILDYPRIADEGAICFIRTMFWWGNFFSSTLHVSGRFKDAHQRNIIHAYPEISLENYYVSTGEDQWVHHFDAMHYRMIKDTDTPIFKTIVEEKPFIKIAAKFPLHDWETAAIQLFERWKRLNQLIT